MQNQQFYGEYRAAVNSCFKTFMTAPREDLLFPPQVTRECGTCNSKHNFSFHRSWSIGTPKQEKTFIEYCAAKNIDMDTVTS